MALRRAALGLTLLVVAASSLDGCKKSARTVSLVSMTYGHGVYVAVGQQENNDDEHEVKGFALRSSDGETWGEVPMPTTGFLAMVYPADKGFIAVGSLDRAVGASGAGGAAGAGGLAGAGGAAGASAGGKSGASGLGGAGGTAGAAGTAAAGAGTAGGAGAAAGTAGVSGGSGQAGSAASGAGGLAGAAGSSGEAGLAGGTAGAKQENDGAFGGSAGAGGSGGTAGGVGTAGAAGAGAGGGAAGVAGLSGGAGQAGGGLSGGSGHAGGGLAGGSGQAGAGEPGGTRHDEGSPRLGLVMLSDDGNVWRQAANPPAAALIDVTKGSAGLVAAARDALYWSSNGEVWIREAVGSVPEEIWYGVEYGNGVYVALGPKPAVSTDGKVWRSITQVPDNQLSGLRFTGNAFYSRGRVGGFFGGVGADDCTLLRSTDGEYWHPDEGVAAPGCIGDLSLRLPTDQQGSDSGQMAALTPRGLFERDSKPTVWGLRTSFDGQVGRRIEFGQRWATVTEDGVWASEDAVTWRQVFRTPDRP